LIPLELVRDTDNLPASIERQLFLERMFQRCPEWEPRGAEFDAALDSILDSFPFDVLHRYRAEESEDQSLYQFATTLITRYVNSITLKSTGATAAVNIQKDARDQVDVLKEFVWQYVIQNPEMAQLQIGQRLAIRTVFSESLSAAREKAGHFFPGTFRKRVAECSSDAHFVRLAADYIAGMTERELMHTYGRLHGIGHM
jgi:dGTP triphosphohydrolase